MTLVDSLRIATAVIIVVVGAVAVSNVLYCLWLTFVALIGRLSARNSSTVETATTRFCILIPAHDEELVIAGTLAEIGKLEYPKDLLTVAVIADNCTDRTVAIASSYPNVLVLERRNLEERGKGFALNWALDQLAKTDRTDTFVIVDADTRIDPSFLIHMDRRRQSNSGRPFAAQGRYDVQNPDDSWRTALMAGALSLVHVVRPLARERLGLTVGLKGNGMALDRSILRMATWSGNSLTEDIEYTLDLLEKLNIRVSFVPEAVVAALMPTTSSGAASQRQRWEGGRAVLLKRRAIALLFKGLIGFNPAFVDAAVDLLLPPLAEIAATLAAWAVLIGIFALEGGAWKVPALIAACCFALLAAYVVGGFAIAGAPALAYRALAYAPFYTVWKLALRLKTPSNGPKDWVRTTREPSNSDEVHALPLDPEPLEKRAAR